MEAPVIYADTTIFTATAIYNTKEGEWSRKFIFTYPTLATSPLAFTDALTTITRISGKEQAIWLCDRFAKLPNIRILPSGAQIVRQVIENFKTTPLSAKKATHLAYMQVNFITRIATLDSEFDKVTGIKRVKL